MSLVRQNWLGTAQDTRGTAFIYVVFGHTVYEDIFDAKAACDHLSILGEELPFEGRYLIVLYFNPSKQTKKDGPEANGSFHSSSNLFGLSIIEKREKSWWLRE
ncbi:hypothetical protein BC830DRAFT_1222366 [Chytriomyces sp. MP71]|nr:hypothetical protein BC830DRAFT_1222366 [Chytriomyces sp. MP71]